MIISWILLLGKSNRTNQMASRWMLLYMSMKPTPSSMNKSFLRHDDDRQNPYQTSFATPRNRSSGNVTPPPNSRHERMSTSSPGANSHHSKSSSDGSWETPIPSSPPHSGTTTTKPPQARSAPITRLGHTPGRGCETNEAFYAKSWMSGFSDAFNFDGFDKDETFDFDGFKFQK